MTTILRLESSIKREAAVSRKLTDRIIARLTAAHPDATLADLYDPDVMPADLRKAHRTLDLAVDRLYRKAPFESDRERVEHLFMLYEKMTAGLLAKPDKPKRRKKADA